MEDCLHDVTIMRDTQATGEPEKSISEKTPMSIGLMVGLIVLVFTIIGGALTFGIGIWQGGRWIGEFTTKLDTIMLDLKIVKDSNSELRLKWDNHESRLLKIETAGSPQLQRLSEQIAQIQRTIDLHMAKELKQ